MTTLAHTEKVNCLFLDIVKKRLNTDPGQCHRFTVDEPTVVGVVSKAVVVDGVTVPNLAHGLLSTVSGLSEFYDKVNLVAVAINGQIGGVKLTYEYEVM